MTAPLPDDDLLALIEGELAPERIERIRTVLMRDPALMRRLEAMQRDRAQMQRVEQLWAAQPHALDPRVISDAVEQAEREALLHVGSVRDTSNARHRPVKARRRRQVTMLASLVLGAGLLGLWSWLLIGHTRQPTPVELAAQPSTSQSAQPTLALGNIERAELAGPPAIFDSVATADPVQTQPSDSSSDESLTDAWLKSAGLATAQPEPALEIEPAVASGLSLADAARLALEGRLKLITDRPPGTVVKAMAAGPSATPLAGPVLDLGSLGSLDRTREITLRVSPSADSQRDMERELSLTVQRLAVTSGASIRFVALDRVATPPGPSMTFDDILWWSRPASQWRPRIEIRVPLELAESAATPPLSGP